MVKNDKGHAGQAENGKRGASKMNSKDTNNDLNVIPSATITKPNSYEEITDAVNQKNDVVELGPSVFVCKHIFTELGEDKVKRLFKKNGYDLDHPEPEETEAEKKARKKKEKERLKAWAECPNSINPANGIYIDPYCPNLGQSAMPGLHSSPQPMASSPGVMTPGSIGVSKNQMVFHMSPLGAESDSSTQPSGPGVKMRLGQSSDGTQCITITYDPPSGVKVPAPCATERETQFLESDCAEDKKGKAGDKGAGKGDDKKKGKGKKGK